MNQRRVLSEPFRNWLACELGLWQQSSLITADQAAKILGMYESPAEGRQRRQSWLAYALVALAMVLFAAAVLLLVSYNWAEIPAAGKLALIFGALAAVYALGFYLRYQREQRPLSDAVNLLGCLLYGAAIWLIAQIFHMSAHYPDGMYWWAIGVLPLAFLLDSLPLHMLLVALVATWCGMEIANFHHLGALFWGWRWHVIPNGCYLALVIAGGGLWIAYRRRSPWRVMLYVPLIAWWTLLQPLAWRFDDYPFYFIASVGALLLVAAESHRPGSQLDIPYRLWGALLFGGSVYLLTFWDFHRWGMFHGNQFWVLTTSGLILALAAVVFGAAEGLRYRYLELGQLAAADHWNDIRRRQWLPLSMVAAMVALSLSQLSAEEQGPVTGLAIWLPVLTANVAMIGLAFWLMWIGLRDDRATPFAGGVLFFLLWIVSRYIDLFGELGGMLGAALMFFLCGCALLGVVWFWRNRKEVSHA
jgi:Predicted membrane protein